MSSFSAPTPTAADKAITPAAPAALGETAAPTAVAGAPARRHRSVHIPALDGVRGLAILLVLIFHFGEVAYMRGADGVARTIQRLCGAGWVGVDLFFVLSGFLITSILCEAVGTAGYFKNFYMRRVLRIFPLYFGVLVVACVILPLAGALPDRYDKVYQHQWALWLYLQNFVQIDWKGFSHFWSLAVEEHFYMVWPAVVLFFGRRGAMAACVAMIVTAIAVRVYRVAVLPDTLPNVQETYLWTICRMDSLAIGSLLALVVNGVASELGRFARVAPWVLLAAVAACAAMLLKHGSFSYTHPTVQAIGYTVVAVGSAALLVMAVNAGTAGWVGVTFNANWLRFLGKYSYGIYVFHNFVHHYLKDVLPLARLQPLVGDSRWAAFAAYVLVAGAISVALALLSWHLYEKHFLKLKRFFEYRATTLEGFRPNEPVAATK